MAPRTRGMDEVRHLIVERARARRNPFFFVSPEEVESALAGLTSPSNRDAWAEAFCALAEPHLRRAAQAEAAADTAVARDAYLAAYNCCSAARYPAANSPGKRHAYRRAQEYLALAARWFDPPVERVSIPFPGRAGESQAIQALLRRPREVARPPVVITWGGIDTFKEERAHQVGPYLEAGLATLAIDMPGVGDAPLVGSEDAERLWDPVFDWLESRDDLDASRLGVLGLSTGSYWATKVAHTHHQRIRAAVNHGGPAHYAFEAAWIERAQTGEYPFELAETLASAWGRATYDDWVSYAPRLSLLRQGVLDRPSAPLLLVNGTQDTVFPIQDMYLLLEHGQPKMARFFPGNGHMGGSHATAMILDWLRPLLA